MKGFSMKYLLSILLVSPLTYCGLEKWKTPKLYITRQEAVMVLMVQKKNKTPNIKRIMQAERAIDKIDKELMRRTMNYTIGIRC